MKKLIFKTATFLAIVLNFTGCIQYVDGVVQIPDSSIVEKNGATKLYYEDINNTAIREDLSNLSTFLNNNEIKPNKWVTSKTNDEVDESDDLKVIFSNNTTNNVVNTKFKLDENSNYLVSNKKYSSRNEAYLDFFNTWQYLNEQTKNNSDLKDKFGTSAHINLIFNSFYKDVLYVDELALNNGILKFTTKRELSRELLQARTEIAFKKSGYQLVSNPNEADKIIYFQLTRDYLESEIKQLKKEGKNLNLGVVNAGMENQTNKIETGMKLASSSSSSSTSAGIGLGTGLIFAAINLLDDKDIIVPTFKITDLKDNKSYLYIPTAFDHLYVEYSSNNTKQKLYYAPEVYYYAMVRNINEDGKYYKRNPIQ